MTSEEGLNAYGAATWGQFFIYQGFNEHAGWMHTTSTVDVVDEFAETILQHDGQTVYRHDGETRPVETKPVTLRYRTSSSALAERTFDVRRTHHGPIVRAEAGKWIATALMHKPVEALTQLFRTHKGRRLARLPQGVGAGRQLVQQHVVCGRQGQCRHAPSAIRPKAE